MSVARQHGEPMDVAGAVQPDRALGPGDVGRRVMLRRMELQLSRQELASRAGMAPSYVQHLEEHSSSVTFDALARLARALDTTTAVLLGAGTNLPPGQGGAGPHPNLDVIGALECRRLLDGGGVGRIVFVSGRGPVAHPVNFHMDNDDVVFRTEAGRELSALVGSGTVSFEVDRVDDATKQGWSVLLTGELRLVEDPAERARVESMGIEPWAGGDRPVYLRLVPFEMTGRRIHRGH